MRARGVLSAFNTMLTVSRADPSAGTLLVRRLAAESVDDGGAPCSSGVDCQLNGLCTGGVCVCDAAWTDANCSRLSLLPAKPIAQQGFSGDTNTSSWGGSIIQGDGATYHLFAAEIAGGCGMQAFSTNSRCVHATSSTVDGPFVRRDVVEDAFCHGASATYDPAAGRWVFFHVGEGCLTTSSWPYVHEYVNNCAAGGVTPASGLNYTNVSSDKPCAEHHKLVSNATLLASNPAGPWEPAPSLPDCGNARAVVVPNGTWFVVCGLTLHVNDTACGGQHSVWSIWRADAWNGSYVQLPPTFSLAGAPTGAASPCVNWEDFTIWLDRRGHFHLFAHAWRWAPTAYPVPGCPKDQPPWAHWTEQGPNCTAFGGHAYSEDGRHWWVSPVAPFTGEVRHTDGTVSNFRARERPSVVVDSSGALTHLVSAVGMPGPGLNTGMLGADRSVTIVQPVGRPRA